MIIYPQRMTFVVVGLVLASGVVLAQDTPPPNQGLSVEELDNMVQPYQYPGMQPYDNAPPPDNTPPPAPVQAEVVPSLDFYLKLSGEQAALLRDQFCQ